MADRYKQFKRHAADLLSAEHRRRTFSTTGPTPLALVYPNEYAVGMASLGFQTVFRLFNETPTFSCERVFFYKDPFGLYSCSLETQRSLSSFPLIAFSLAYELDDLNVIQMLRQAGIPLLARERTELDPLILLGGVTMFYNPTVMAPLADIIFLGEAESLIPRFTECFAGCRSRAELLQMLAQEPGFYIPAVRPERPLHVQHASVRDMLPATSYCVPQESHLNMFMVEVGRGCGRGCRFCTAGHVYHPFRLWPMETILSTVERFAAPGDRIGLVGAALSDYPDLDVLCDRLLQRGFSISLSSLRIDRISKLLLDALHASDIDTITLAPEAGSERLRNVIRKNLSDEQILAAAELVAASSVKTVKLYYMLGLPTETDTDVDDLCALTATLVRILKKKTVRVGVSTFIPKPCTPFQWAALAAEREVKTKWKKISSTLRRLPGVTVSSGHVKEDMLQALLSVGDASVGEAMVATEVEGWDWHRHPLFAQLFHVRERSAPLPWDFIECGLSKERLWNEWQKAVGASRSEGTVRGEVEEVCQK
jgi:radical SAM superfamily enzyme YgiQ (UPF0313 family)